MTTPHASPDEPVTVCPYWHQVTADFALRSPAGGYCIAGCHLRIKFMAEQTFQDVCAMNFAECEGYQRLLAEEEARQRQTPGAIRR